MVNTEPSLCMLVRCKLFHPYVVPRELTSVKSVCIIGFCWGADYYKAKPLFIMVGGALGTIFFIIVTCVTTHMVQYVFLILAFGCVYALPPLVSAFLFYKAVQFFDNKLFVLGPYLGAKCSNASSGETWCGYRPGERLGMFCFHLWRFPLAQPGRT